MHGLPFPISPVNFIATCVQCYLAGQKVALVVLKLNYDEKMTHLPKINLHSRRNSLTGLMPAFISLFNSISPP